MTRRNPKQGNRKVQHNAAPRPQRASGGGYWIVGRHAVMAALQNQHRKILKVWSIKELAGELAHAVAERKIQEVRMVEPRAIQNIAPEGAPHQGIAAEILPLPDKAVFDIANPKRIMVLDQVTDPHNVGAILRSCAAFGVDALIMPKDNSPSETATMAKAASGALELVPVVKVTNLVATLQELKDEGFWVLGMDGTATTDLYNAPAYDKVALVMGAEGEGMRRLTREYCDLLVKLPIAERMESLNVSNAAAIGLYELSRAR